MYVPFLLLCLNFLVLGRLVTLVRRGAGLAVGGESCGLYRSPHGLVGVWFVGWLAQGASFGEVCGGEGGDGVGGAVDAVGVFDGSAFGVRFGALGFALGGVGGVGEVAGALLALGASAALVAFASSGHLVVSFL